MSVTTKTYAEAEFIDVRIWPKADLRNRAFWGVLMSGFGKSGHSANIEQKVR